MDTLTVAQMAQILCNATGLESGSDENGYWAGKAIKTCLDWGYIADRGEISSVNYDVPILREEAVVVMYLARYKNSPVESEDYRSFHEAHRYFPDDIPDYTEIWEQYQEDVVNAYGYNITNGVDDIRTFAPKMELTRAEVCQLFYNVGWTESLDQP